MYACHEDLCKMFPWFLSLPENRQIVLCEYFDEVGFLGLVNTRGIMVAAKRGDERGVCAYLHDESKESRYMNGKK